MILFFAGNHWYLSCLVHNRISTRTRQQIFPFLEIEMLFLQVREEPEEEQMEIFSMATRRPQQKPGSDENSSTAEGGISSQLAFKKLKTGLIRPNLMTCVCVLLLQVWRMI